MLRSKHLATMRSSRPSLATRSSRHGPDVQLSGCIWYSSLAGLRQRSRGLLASASPLAAHSQFSRKPEHRRIYSVLLLDDLNVKVKRVVVRNDLRAGFRCRKGSRWRCACRLPMSSGASGVGWSPHHVLCQRPSFSTDEDFKSTSQELHFISLVKKS